MLVESVDQYAMNRTKNLSMALSLGLLAALGGAALAQGVDDPRVRAVELPYFYEGFAARLTFSGDGSTIIFQEKAFVDQRISVYRDGVWALVLDYSQMDRHGVPEFAGVSADGSVFAITDSTGSFVSRDGVISEVPNVWVDDSGQVVLDGNVYVRSVSSDGQTLGLSGSSDSVPGTDALIWNNAQGMMNLNIGFTGDEAGHQILAMSGDGSVIAGSSSFYAPMNNIRYHLSFHESWVVSAKGMQIIPNLNPGYDVFTRVMGMSNDGQVVVGISGGRWRNEQPLTGAFGGVSIDFGPVLSWIWTPELGTQQIVGPKGYTQIIALDVSGDGQTIFGVSDGAGDSGRFLWTRKGGFVSVEDLLAKRGIKTDLVFQAISLSDNGNLLMGWGNNYDTDQRFVVIIDISE
jgi:hypothetical protein